MDEPMNGNRRWRTGQSSGATLGICPLLCCLYLLAPLATAQTEPERLPDLTPRAFEIRGDLQISLPDLERQPLRGFAPPPRTYVVPADRRAFVAPYRQRLDDLPADPLAAPPPPQIATRTPVTGRLDAGVGRYFSRLGRFTVGREGVGVDARYSGFSSFQPFSGDSDAAGLGNLDAVSDVFSGRVAYRSAGPVRVGVGLDGGYQRYTLVGAFPSLASTRSLRTGRVLGGEVALGGAAFDVRARFASTRYQTDRPATLLSSGDGFDLDETRLSTDGTVQIGSVRLDAAGALAGLEAEGLGESLESYRVGGSLRVDLGRSELDVGARVLGYGASEANGGGSSTTVGPVVRFETPLSPTARLSLRTAPRASGGSLADLFLANPFAVPQPIVAPDLHVLDGEIGLELQRRSVRVSVYSGLRLSPVLRYFERTAEPSAAGLYEARYDGATVVRGGAAATLYAASGVRATAGAEVRSGTLDGGGGIPYFAPLTGQLSLAVPFAAGRGLLQVTASAEASRPTETAGRNADAWATLDAEAQYGFASGIGLWLRAERLAGRAEQWPGFPRPPATVLAGLRVRW